MNRRLFFGHSALLFGAAALLPSMVLADESNTTRRFKVSYDFDIKYDEPDFPAKLWNPIPQENEYQKILYYTQSGNYDSYNINSQNPYGAKTLFAKWNKNSKSKKLRVDMIVETSYRSVPLDQISKASAKNLPIPEEVKQYLIPTRHIPTDGIIEALANRITVGKTDRFEKVKAIYYWSTSHTFRDSKVIGCGTGDVGKMVTQKEVEDIYKNGYFGGKCTDLSSLFTALVRAAGVPVREVFGIRLGKSNFSKALGKSDSKGFADISTWQHCRAEYYIPGIGWIPSDPADITKLMLVENLKYNDSKVKELTDRYLHSWEMNWIGFNSARDFVLSPKPEQFPLNMFGYPYAEADDEVLNYYDPKEFGYQITSQEL